MQIAKNKVVMIEYHLTGPDGNVLDSSRGHDPLAYLQGAGNLIPGLERELEGKSAGDAVNVTIAPEDAYGKRDASLVQSVPRNRFKGINNLAVGMQFRTQGEGGGPGVVTVTKIEGDQVTIDANHPLAGVRLTFDVKVIGVRDATAEELSHGHVHGPGGHHH